MSYSRRDFLLKGSLFAVAGIAGINYLKSEGIVTPLIDKQLNPTPQDGFTLPELPYSYSALEPHIDALTMEIHHNKHHKSYVANLNKEIAKLPDGKALPLVEMLQQIGQLPVAIRNNAGGHYNHMLFWQLMKPGGGGLPNGKLGEEINSTFGSFENFKNKFNEAALSRFGSGWAWLVADQGKLKIGSTPNQDNPLMNVSEFKGQPILALDVWEHAYYLNYQNKRAEYISNWWNVVNWDKANELFAKSK